MVSHDVFDGSGPDALTRVTAVIGDPRPAQDDLAKGQMLWPVLSGTARLVLTIAGGALAASLGAIFGVIAAGLVVFGSLTMLIVARSRWT